MKIRGSVVAFALVMPSLAMAQVAPEMPAEYRAVLDGLGKQGDFKDGVLKVKGQYWLDDIMMSAVSAAAIPAAEVQLAELLRARHRIREGTPDDFNLRHPTEIAEAIAASAKTMEILLASVASVSLLVGGVGIMNIMLVSVTERTREIGLRMAVGARGRDVLRQFLLEALLLSLAGGLIGIALGMGSTRTISEFFEWPTRVSANAIAMSVMFAAAIGVFFGYYPARRAARLDPIEALRHE
jgi:putative ABC transport system permease protein